MTYEHLRADFHLNYPILALVALRFYVFQSYRLYEVASAALYEHESSIS